MKQIFKASHRQTVLLSLLLLFHHAAFAWNDVTVGGITYRLDCMLTGTNANIGSSSFLDTSGSTTEDGYPSAVVLSAQKDLFSGELVIPNLITANGQQYQVVGIGESAFKGFTAITSLSLPQRMWAIGNYAFSGCTNLATINLPDELAKIGQYAFQNSGLKSLTLSKDYLEIGTYAFSGCSALEELSITTWVLSVYGTPFSNCSVKKLYVNLEKVESWLPAGSVTDLTFGPDVCTINSMKATNLTVLTLPKNIESIASRAFSGCNSLNTVISEIESPFSFPQNAFSSYSATLFVPKGTKSNYTATNYWNKFTKIMEISDEPEAYVIYNDGVLTFYYDNQNYTRTGTIYSLDEMHTYYDWDTAVSYPGWYDNREYVTKAVFTPSFADARPTSMSRWFCNFINLTEIVGMEYLNASNVTGTFEMFSCCKKLTSITIPSGVTSIGWCAFEGCSGLTSVTIPSSVTSIGDFAFPYCSSLTSVTIPSSVTSIGEGAFMNCSGLTSVTIPSNVTSIGKNPFRSCNGLTSITVDAGNPNYDSRGGCNAIIETATNVLVSGCENTVLPSGVTSIGSLAFEGCSGLTSVTIPDGVTSIGSSAFEGCSGLTSVTIPDGVTSIEGSAFSRCSGLTSVTISSSVTSIGKDAFYGCSALKTVHITNLKAWCEISFSGYFANPLSYAHHLYLNGEEIKDLVIPDGVTSIGYHFRLCSGLTSVTIPSSVTSIESEAFYGCSSLTSVTFLSGVTKVGGSAFKGCTSLTTVMIGDFDNSVFNNCPSIKNVTILDGATKIDDNVFKDFTKLENVVIGNTVKSIGKSAFEGCTSLKKMRIPSGVTTIGEAAFADCSSMTTVVIPNSVTSIGNRAFENCIGLTSINSFINVPKKLDESVFGCSSSSGYDASTIYIIANLYVPRGRTNLYAAVDGWKLFSSLAEKDVAYELTYVVDGEVYTSYELQQGVTITPEGYPVKYGYVFSGWDTVPATMPDHDVVVYGSFQLATDLTPMDTAEDDHVFSSDFTADTNLQGMVINNVYYNIDGSGYDAATGSIVMSTPVSDEQVEAIVGKSVTDEEVANGYNGIIFMVPTGKGKIDVDVQTAGSYTLSVKVGEQEARHITKVERGKVSVTYSVDEPTMVYIYASTASGARSLRGISDTNSVNLYGFKWAAIGYTGDLSTRADFNNDGNVDMQDVTILVDYILKK